MDLETVTLVGEKLVEMPDDVGADSEQLTAQQSRLANTSAVLSLLLALSQHFIISTFGECKGIPAITPAAIAISKKANVKRLTITVNI